MEERACDPEARGPGSGRPGSAPGEGGWKTRLQHGAAGKDVVPLGVRSLLNAVRDGSVPRVWSALACRGVAARGT